MAAKSKKQVFSDNTSEHGFTVNDRNYVLRHCNGDICCDAPWDESDDWPSASFVPNPNDEEYTETCSYKVIGAVWTKSDKKLVAIWTAEDGDGHVDFFSLSEYEQLAQEDLNDISDELCTSICEEMIDVFDDGSGSERSPTAVDSFNCPEWLSDYYRQ